MEEKRKKTGEKSPVFISRVSSSPFFSFRSTFLTFSSSSSRYVALSSLRGISCCTECLSLYLIHRCHSGGTKSSSRIHIDVIFRKKLKNKSTIAVQSKTAIRTYLQWKWLQGQRKENALFYFSKPVFSLNFFSENDSFLGLWFLGRRGTN